MHTPSTQRHPQNRNRLASRPHCKTSHPVGMRKGARQPQEYPFTPAPIRLLPFLEHGRRGES